MDQRKAEIFAEARAKRDRLKDIDIEFAISDAERDPFEVEAQQADALIVKRQLTHDQSTTADDVDWSGWEADMARRAAQLPRETVQKAMNYGQQPQQQTATTTDEAWNAWFSAGFANHIKQHEAGFSEKQVDVIVEFVCTYVGRHLDKVRKEIAAMGNSIVKGEAQGVYVEGKTIGTRSIKIATEKADITPITRGRHVG